jgi:hypothetical protein
MVGRSPPVSALARRWRGAALLPAGLFAVHQLRVLLEFGAGDGGLSTAYGHLHVASLLPWVVVALAAGLGGLLTHIAGVLRRGALEGDAPASLGSLWAWTGVSLIALHALHEGLEGLLLNGSGFAGLLGMGGVFALLAAIVVSGLIALALRGVRALLAVIARAQRRLPAYAEALRRAAPPRSVRRRPGAPLARSAAGRAPPQRPRLAA